MKITTFLLCVTLFAASCSKINTNPGNLQNSYNDQQLGASAHDLLSDSKYTTLNIEVQYMPGYHLDDASISNVTSYLNTLCHKPGGINIIQSEIAANGDTLDPQKISIIEKQNRTMYTTGNTIALYILVTDGYDTSVNTLGFAYRNTSLCLLGKNIFDHTGGLFNPTRESLVSSVLEHELGHILGLVNTGTPMVTNHEDANHSRHCNNQQCLMYYAIDVHFSGAIHPNTIPQLDDNCRQDLRANGGK